MEIGLGVLRLPPDQFWQLTLPELAAALRGINGQTTGRSRPPSGQDLSVLMAQFPDVPKA